MTLILKNSVFLPQNLLSMKIQKIHLVNFKRFTNIEIDNIPESSKLVVLIGSNGSGKSSIFDAFNFMDSAIKKDISINDDFWNYFKKEKELALSVKIQLDHNIVYQLTDTQFKRLDLAVDTFYGRSSLRQIPRLTRTVMGKTKQSHFKKDADRPKFFIERDNRFENDVERVTEDILKAFFVSDTPNQEIKQQYVAPINQALQRVFGGINGTKLELLAMLPPTEGKPIQILFRKGKSEISYNYLGAGEKEVFNLLLNLLNRTKLYQNTIYYLDEMDVHLNTQLQYNLLKEIIENWLPSNCQLWTATHSLGFIEYAQQSEFASIIDFDDLDYDYPRVLSPVPKDNPDIYEIAVGKSFLPALFQQMKIFFVENKDRDYYATIGIAQTVFVADNNRNNVYHKVRSTNLFGIVDRDFLSDYDIERICKQYQNLRILNYYSIENYMYHPDNLLEYFENKGLIYDKKIYINDLKIAKNQIKDYLILQITLARSSYPYFGEPEFNNNPLQKRFKNQQENIEQSVSVQRNLNSDDFETFYKSLPMKTYCTQLKQRQNIAKSDLVKTEWFKLQIESLIFANT
jgi:predicted ATP-dependent endonuclease of OLD family